MTQTKKNEMSREEEVRAWEDRLAADANASIEREDSQYATRAERRESMIAACRRNPDYYDDRGGYIGPGAESYGSTERPEMWPAEGPHQEA